VRKLSYLCLVVALVLPLGVSRAADFTKLTDVRLAMDDGVKLAADVYSSTSDSTPKASRSRPSR
jgi:predicted acyl esterase